MPDVRSSISICKRLKDRLKNLDFVRKQSDEKIVEILMDFYEGNKEEFVKWKKRRDQR